MGEATAREVALDPQWLPHTYDTTGAMLTSVFVPRDQHSKLMFLSDEHFEDRFPKVAQPAGAVATEVAEAAKAPIHFIFHTAFCCSTLMLKALDIPGRTFGINEPDVLINLANRFIRRDDLPNRERLRLVLRLLQRPFGAGETMIVKPTNFANRLIAPVLETSPHSRAVLLYSDVRTLLRSLLKRGMWGRIWGRKLFQSASSWSSIDLGYTEEEKFILTDLQALALGWLLQIHQFGEIARQMAERIVVINSEEFLAKPAATLLEVGRLFELDLDESEVAGIVNGRAFAKHSKFSGRSYGQNDRGADHDAAESAHHEELEMVVKWVEAVASHMGVDMKPATGSRA